MGSKAKWLPRPMPSRLALPTSRISGYPFYPSFPRLTNSIHRSLSSRLISLVITRIRLTGSISMANGHLYNHFDVTYRMAPGMSTGSYAWDLDGPRPRQQSSRLIFYIPYIPVSPLFSFFFSLFVQLSTYDHQHFIYAVRVSHQFDIAIHVAPIYVGEDPRFLRAALYD
ncbi:hypothetical protein ARMGADRAFT_1061027 [Armillaria gallica]|uniref:Uncharacterized protein n=1 Tax=Armillaria gallica TaxID=47427 RepID=A0A2H3E6T6_ARMGA|nr:hypothetical protein ARMGADRAFT_1061027 [Armillaria gallica]